MDITAILRQRDRQSFNWLYDRYAAMLFGIILRMVEENAIAESLLQETFVEAWKSLEEFDGKNGDLFIWMLRIARVKAKGYIRYRGQEEQRGGNNSKEFWTSSFHQQMTGQKQYSNY